MTPNKIAARPGRALTWAAASLTALLLAAVGWLALSAGGDTTDEAPPSSDGSCPESSQYKGNAESSIFHAPGQRYYDETTAERCFSTREAATAAGFRAAQV